MFIPDSLKIVIFRHAQSESNLLRICDTDPKIFCTSSGLTELGKKQAKASAIRFFNEFLTLFEPGNAEGLYKLEVISSDFLRAKETAEIFSQEIEELFKGKWPDYYCDYKVNARIDSRFRERFVNEIDGKDDRLWYQIWKKDSEDDNHHLFGAESPNDVLQRMVAGVEDIVKENEGKEKKIVVITSHGESLQILQTRFRKVRPGLFDRTRETHMENAQLRLLGDPISIIE